MKRSVNTSFWSDPYIESLSPDEKLLFLYLLTNDNTNMLGIYQTTIRRISFETGLTEKAVNKSLERFSKDGKVRFEMERYILIPNFLKHQKMNTNMQKSAIDTYNDLPKELRFKELPYPLQRDSKAFESLCKAFGSLPKIELELELEGEEEEEEEKKGRFAPPSLLEVQNEIKEKGYSINAESFIAFYESKGWMVGKNKMKSWTAALVTWNKRMESQNPAPTKSIYYD